MTYIKESRTKVGSGSCDVAPEQARLGVQVINECTPGGAISPATCHYYDKWLDF